MFYPRFTIAAVRTYLQPKYFFNSVEFFFSTSRFHSHRSYWQYEGSRFEPDIDGGQIYYYDTTNSIIISIPYEDPTSHLLLLATRVFQTRIFYAASTYQSSHRQQARHLKAARLQARLHSRLQRQHQQRRLASWSPPSAR